MASWAHALSVSPVCLQEVLARGTVQDFEHASVEVEDEVQWQPLHELSYGDWLRRPLDPLLAARRDNKGQHEVPHSSHRRCLPQLIFVELPVMPVLRQLLLRLLQLQKHLDPLLERALVERIQVAPVLVHGVLERI